MADVRSLEVAVKVVFHLPIYLYELTLFSLRTTKGRTFCFPIKKRSFGQFFKCRVYLKNSIIFFFYLGFLSRTFTNLRTAGEGGGHFFNSSLPLPPASQTLRHQPGDYCRALTSAHSQQPDSNLEPLVKYKIAASENKCFFFAEAKYKSTVQESKALPFAYSK